MNSLIRNQRRGLRPSLYNPIDRFFGNDFLDFWDGDTPEMTIPAINISEEKNNYKIELAAPGLKKEDFQIEVEGNVMTISSEQETETKEPKGAKEDNYTRREYNYSSFSRSFTLPENADAENVKAKYADGVLNLTVPKKAGTQKEKGHKITVE
jgi:HSP20 family protein